MLRFSPILIAVLYALVMYRFSAWRTARELDAADAKVHTALIGAYDKLGDEGGALAALFGSIRLAPHNLEAYEDLERRFRKAGDTAALSKRADLTAERFFAMKKCNRND